MSVDGSIEWMCLPRFDSPSIFAAILDRGAGSFRFGPDEMVPVARRYEPGTNVIETTWATETGWVVVRDALLVQLDGTHAGRRHMRAGPDAAAGDPLSRGFLRDPLELRRPARLRP